MFKKILSMILVLTVAILLVSCEEITDDYNKAQEPSITLNNEGQLLQTYDETSDLEDVVFTLKLNKFEENEITDYEINWYVRGQLIDEYKNKLSITQVVRSPGEIPVKAVVSFKYENKNKELEANSLIEVVKVSTKISLTNNIDESTHLIDVDFSNSTVVGFTGVITGNLNHNVIKWVIQRQTDTEPELVEEIILEENDGYIKTENEIRATYDYEFLLPGNYIVTLQSGEGSGQDANNHISNSIHVNVNFGNFAISSKDDRVKTSDFNERVLEINKLNPEAVGEGSYELHLVNSDLDPISLSDDGISASILFTHDDLSVGGYLYRAVFIPSPTNTKVTEPIKTNPYLIVNGVEVDDQDTLLQALEDKVEGIVLTKDISTQQVDPITIDYPTTLFGDNVRLIGPENQVFLRITSDKVNISGLQIEKSNKYSLHIRESEKIYLENLKLKEMGTTNMNEVLDGDFNAGVYVDRSNVVIKNIEFLDGALVGVRVDQHLGVEGIAVAEILGDFLYNTEDPVLIPIGSAKSSLGTVSVIASGFDYFALPAGDITIRRWDNIGDSIEWQIYDPEKVEYETGEYLDLFGVGINIDINFLKGIAFEGADGLSFVKSFISYFGQYGIAEITDLNDETLHKYYVVGEVDKDVYGKDRLFYSLDKEIPTKENGKEPVRPTLPEESGVYKIKIYIGEEFYLGHLLFTIK